MNKPPSEMTDREPIKVGQKLWYVGAYGNPHFVDVTKVGRKWIEAGRQRFHIDTLRGDYDRSHGQAYRTREEWEEIRRRDSAWDKLRAFYRDTMFPPKEMTTGEIEASLAAILAIRERAK